MHFVPLTPKLIKEYDRYSRECLICEILWLREQVRKCVLDPESRTCYNIISESGEGHENYSNLRT
jgi:hypothetical protein